jgi:hypothetical protein
MLWILIFPAKILLTCNIPTSSNNHRLSFLTSVMHEFFFTKLTVMRVTIVLAICVLAMTVNAQNTKAPMENKTAKGAALTEKEVKEYITHYWTKDCHDFEECIVTFDSPVRIAPAERHSFPNGITIATSYPVKVEYTHSVRNKSIGGKPVVAHHTGGVLYFYRDTFGDWQMQAEGQDMKFAK